MRNKKYILTDNDYKNISKKLKDDIYNTFIVDGVLENHCKYASRFEISVDKGELDNSYSIWIGDYIPKNIDEFSEDMIVDIVIMFYGNDDNEYEINVDISSINFSPLTAKNELTTGDKNQIFTVGELIEFLKTLDSSATLTAEYIHIIGSHFVGIEKRNLLKTLFTENNNNSYTIKALLAW